MREMSSAVYGKNPMQEGIYTQLKHWPLALGRSETLFNDKVTEAELVLLKLFLESYLWCTLMSQSCVGFPPEVQIHRGLFIYLFYYALSSEMHV